ncbi:MAG TPA: GNAT family N-acetyltransferase, partial [Deinococcales bacterium]|nr:GNAT family N-acetyltransferase [Deinococcales bacterium]
PDDDPPVAFEPEEAVRLVTGRPGFLPEGMFLAVTPDGEYAGLTGMMASAAEPVLYIGLTGVGRAYRRRGVAMALKLRAAAFAAERGIEEIRTWNDSTNRPMLAINEALGFARQPAWVKLRKTMEVKL